MRRHSLVDVAEGGGGWRERRAEDEPIDNAEEKSRSGREESGVGRHLGHVEGRRSVIGDGVGRLELEVSHAHWRGEGEGETRLDQQEVPCKRRAK
jgi:hypothetical protein